MRFLLVSADDPSVKNVLDIPDRLVSKKVQVTKKIITKTKRLEKVKHAGSKKGKVSNKKRTEPINKPNQTSKSIIRKHGSAHHRHQ